MTANLGTGQVFAAALAEDRPDWRGSERKGIVFTADWTAVSERTLVDAATKQGREGPFPADMDIGLFGDAVWAKGVASPLVALYSNPGRLPYGLTCCIGYPDIARGLALKDWISAFSFRDARWILIAPRGPR
ncbi:hypothetical protein HDF16_004347 [Granulicella aggregans]|uniref:Uncharacterized protein n=1 Tax=Granulicella aggregans TaxID=474949 RepID=A0A7W7ZI15_9BACT|nr:hypothetical protein [Granulicella aggregans]